jgi:hypothetical protein
LLYCVNRGMVLLQQTQHLGTEPADKESKRQNLSPQTKKTQVPQINKNLNLCANKLPATQDVVLAFDEVSDRATSSICSCSSPHITTLAEQAPTLGTSSLTLRLREPCWDPAPCVPCYMHQQGNASATWPGAQQVRPCPLEPMKKWTSNDC